MVSTRRPQAYASIVYLAEGVTYEKNLFQAKQPDNRILDYKENAKHRRQAFLYCAIDFNEETLEIICEALVSELGISVTKNRRKAVPAQKPIRSGNRFSDRDRD